MHAIQLLLNEGADIQTSDDDGVSALHHSSSVGYMGTVKPLLDQGADIQAEDKKTRRYINSACAGHMPLLDRYPTLGERTALLGGRKNKGNG